MPLSIEKHPEFRFDGDYIHFKADNDAGRVVCCAVMVDFLTARAAVSGMEAETVRATFMMFRPEIAEIASAKYDQGIERPVITPNDLNAHFSPTALPVWARARRA